jgi:formylglycine-generating enzyme required for sulfatase activity
VIEEDGRRKEQKEKIEKRFLDAIDGTRAVFNLVEPGSALMGVGETKSIITIDRPYEMMATPVTQIIWRRVAVLACLRFPGAHLSDLNPNPSAFRGDTRPVESVSLEDVELWIGALNNLSASGEPELENIIHGHKTGDVYRLPTNWEWEFVVRGRGSFNDGYSFGNDESLVGQYAWWSDNSGDETHPVAEKLPIRIGQSEFFDMHGNVWEWTVLSTNSDGEPTYVTRGGAWDSVAPNMRSGAVFAQKPDTYSHTTGFRLVRDVK